MTSDLEQIHDEVRIIRRDLEEIKAMLIQEVVPTKEEKRAVAKGLPTAGALMDSFCHVRALVVK